MFSFFVTTKKVDKLIGLNTKAVYFFWQNTLLEKHTNKKNKKNIFGFIFAL